MSEEMFNAVLMGDFTHILPQSVMQTLIKYNYCRSVYKVPAKFGDIDALVIQPFSLYGHTYGCDVIVSQPLFNRRYAEWITRTIN